MRSSLLAWRTEPGTNAANLRKKDNDFIRLRPCVMAVADSFGNVFLHKNKNKRIIVEITKLRTSSHQFSIKNLISKSLISELCLTCERFRIFDPTVTLYCWIFQVLNRCSSKTALANLNIQRDKEGLKLVSMNTSALTKAKKKISEEVLKKIACSFSDNNKASHEPWKFKGKDVFLGDGTIIKLEDSEENRQEFPMSIRNGKPHGRPKMRAVALFCARTGLFLDAEIGKYKGKGQSETTLFRKLIPRIRKGSIVVLDRLFTDYFLRSYLKSEGVSYVVRSRNNKAKKALGKKSDIVVTEKGRCRNGDRKEFEQSLPSKMETRYVKSIRRRKGFRDSTIYIITNLFKEDGFSKKDIEELYLRRWSVEVDIRHLKETLGASTLRSKKPDQCKKELWVHFISFNIIRMVNNMSSSKNGITPRKQAFKISLETFLMTVSSYGADYEDLLLDIVKKEILKSKYRCEPRLVRYRNDKYGVLNFPRVKARENLRKLGHVGTSKDRVA